MKKRPATIGKNTKNSIELNNIFLHLLNFVEIIILHIITNKFFLQEIDKKTKRAIP